MKSIFLASAAAAALFAAPALAQDAIGSVGVAYTHAEFESDFDSADLDGAVIDGVVATPAFGDWTVTFNASGVYSDSDLGDETSLNGGVHLTKAVEDMRFGGFVSAAELPAGQNLMTFGAEGQKYFDRATLTGVVSYGTVFDADIWTVGGEDRKSTRLNSSHVVTSYAVFCLKTKHAYQTNHEPPHYTVHARPIS